MMTSEVEDVVQMLITEGKRYEESIKKAVSICEDISKMMEIKKLDFMKMVEEPGLSLRGVQGRLYRLLKEGQAKEVMPEMVFGVIEDLTNQSNEEMERLKAEVARMGDQVTQTIEDSFGEMRKLWGTANEAKEQKEIVVVVP